MPLIKWRNSYSVGIARFDDQHAVLVEMINNIFVAVRNKKAASDLHDSIDKLVEYTHTHFEDEEAAMKQVGYPFLAEHREEHAALKNQVNDFVKKIKEEQDEVTVEFYQFLRRWLLNHIVQEDQKYTSYLTRDAASTETAQ